MKNINQMMKQAQQMQQKMQEIQEKLQATEMTGKSGGGMVEVTINGKGELKNLKVDKSLVDPEEVEMMEDLIVAAFNDAKTKMDEHTAKEMSAITGGLPGGMGLPF